MADEPRSQNIHEELLNKKISTAAWHLYHTRPLLSDNTTSFEEFTQQVIHAYHEGRKRSIPRYQLNKKANKGQLTFKDQVEAYNKTIDDLNASIHEHPQGVAITGAAGVISFLLGDIPESKVAPELRDSASKIKKFLDKADFDLGKSLLEQYSAKNSPDKAFVNAAKNNHAWNMKKLLELYPNININYLSISQYQNIEVKGTALHSAVCAKNYEAVKFLLEKGASTTVADHVGKTPIQYCSSPEILQLFNPPQQVQTNTTSEQRNFGYS